MIRVPQRIVLSPTFFNLYIHDISFPTYPDVHVLSYADAIKIFSQHPDPETAPTYLQEYIYTLEPWFHTKVLSSRSTLTLITPGNRQPNPNPNVILSNTPVGYLTLTLLKHLE